MTSAVAALATATATGAASPAKGKSDAFSMETFMKLIAAQMSNQDPMNPQSNTEFIAQMAQFTQLQTLQSISASLKANEATSAAGLLGTTVSYKDGYGFPLQGTVTRVLTADAASGLPLRVVIDGQTTIPFDQVTEISRAS